MKTLIRIIRDDGKLISSLDDHQIMTSTHQTLLDHSKPRLEANKAARCNGFL